MSSSETSVERLVEDQPAVAQHHHAVGDGADLGHLVGGVHHRDAVFAQPPDDAVEPLDLAFGDGRGRLVEHHHLRAGAGGLDDLHDLAQTDGQAAHPGGRRDVHAEDRQGFLRLTDHRLAVQERPGLDLPSHEQVFVDRHVLDGRQLLRHDGHAVADRVARVAGRQVGARHRHRAAVGAVLAADDLHQRRLAGTVLTGQRGDRARVRGPG